MTLPLAIFSCYDLTFLMTFLLRPLSTKANTLHPPSPSLLPSLFLNITLHKETVSMFFSDFLWSQWGFYPLGEKSTTTASSKSLSIRGVVKVLDSTSAVFNMSLNLNSLIYRYLFFSVLMVFWRNTAENIG